MPQGIAQKLRRYYIDLLEENKMTPARQGRAGGFSCIHLPERAHFLGFLMAACAAASRAIGTRKGLQET